MLVSLMPSSPSLYANQYCALALYEDAAYSQLGCEESVPVWWPSGVRNDQIKNDEYTQRDNSQSLADLLKPT